MSRTKRKVPIFHGFLGRYKKWLRSPKSLQNRKEVKPAVEQMDGFASNRLKSTESRTVHSWDDIRVAGSKEDKLR